MLLWILFILLFIVLFIKFCGDAVSISDEGGIRKIKLANGGCSLRNQCENINCEVCNTIPKKGQNYILCSYFEETKIVKDNKK